MFKGEGVMAESDFHQIEKLVPYKAKPKSQTVQDSNLNVQLSRETQAESPISFKSIYSTYMNETTKVQSEGTVGSFQGDDIKLAMEEAKNAFNSMMEIREQLNQAYKEFMQMQ